MNETDTPTIVISKILSKNDVGDSGSHQAGICLPKKGEFLTFFPELDVKQKNPGVLITFIDEEDGSW